VRYTECRRLHGTNADYKEAIGDFSKALELDANNFKAFYNLALCHANLEKYGIAAEEMSSAIALNPAYADAYHLRGLAYEYNGDLARAVADYEKALELKPDDEESEMHLKSIKEKKERDGTLSTTSGGRIEVAVPAESKAKVSLADVGGMKKLKERIVGMLSLLKDPHAAEKYGVGFGGGILFYGPPGCGKSFVAEAIAGEAGVTFIRTSIAETLNMYVGNSEKNLHAIFEAARAKQPAIIFFDEIEALGGSRENMAEHWSRALVNHFLMEMDQIEKRRERILVIGATNAPWYMDHALKRSGRFSESILIGPPDPEGREEIFRLRSRKIELLDGIDYRRLATMSDGFSCADIDTICTETAQRVWLEKTGRKVRTEDFALTIERGAREGRFRTVREWSDIAKRHDGDGQPSGLAGKKENMFG
jgi:SpoVK/Ycf46/Vps4 family AAA+-type ATPase